MDAKEEVIGGSRSGWRGRLSRVRLLVRDEALGRFTRGERLRIDQLLHLVGMVGAGKSTLRDILTYHLVTRTSRRVTLVVGDVAETLAVVELFKRLGVAAAPILGHSTRERNIGRLHRRTAVAGADTMLGHDHPGFAYLSSACPVDVLRGMEARRPLGIREAPCLGLYPAVDQEETPDDPLVEAENPPTEGRAPSPSGSCARCGTAVRDIAAPGTSSMPASGLRPPPGWCIAPCPSTSTTSRSVTWNSPADSAT